MLIYLLVIFSIYFGFLLGCMKGWKIFSSRVSDRSDKNNAFASVIVAMRNEAATITTLLNTLLTQKYPRDKFEVILVDDHSADNTCGVIIEWMKDNPTMKVHLLTSGGTGKKMALSEGIHHAQGEFMLTTDADCQLPADWILQMVNSFAPTTSMVIGLVKIHPGKSLFSKLQALEFSSLTGSSMALQALGLPVMCNGASLAFRKSKYEALHGYEGNLHIPSGDDEFLMRKLNKNFPGSITSVKGLSMVVATHPQPTLKSFVHQRLRWAGKWRANDSVTANVLALFILVFQISTVIAICLLITGNHPWMISLLLMVKVILEAVYLNNVSVHIHQPFSIPAFLVLQVVYPLYVVIIGVLSQLFDYEWKDRSQPSLG